MAIINLTQDYLKNGNPTIYEKIKSKSKYELEEYFADSLHEMCQHFKSVPPKKIDKYYKKKSGLVFMEDVWIKRDADAFDEDDGVSLQGMDEGHCSPPFFKIKDSYNEALCAWRGGDSNWYLYDKEKFGFNKKTFVKIPEILLLYVYRENKDYGMLDIRALGEKGNFTNRKKKRKEKKTLETKSVFQPRIPVFD